MANYCSTDVIVTGKRDSLVVLKTIMEKCEEKGKLENGWGNTWLGNLVDAFGEDWQKIPCRGTWDVCEDETEYLRFYTESAWAPTTELFKMIERHLPDLKIYYSAEEPGCCIYETNDVEGKYFPDRCQVDWYVHNHGEGTEYFRDLGEALNFIQGMAGREINTVEDVEEFCEEIMQDDYYVYINEFEVVTN